MFPEDVPLYDPILLLQRAAGVVDLNVCLPVPPGADLENTWTGEDTDEPSALDTLSPLVLGLSVAIDIAEAIDDTAGYDALVRAARALIVAWEAIS